MNSICYFDNIPQEIIFHIFSYTSEWNGIISNVNHLYRYIIKDTNKNKIPPIDFFQIIFSIDLVKWAIQSGCNNIDLSNYAAKYGKLDIIKYIKETKSISIKDISRLSAFYGHINILKWIYQINYLWNSETFSAAASSGNLEVVKYLHINGSDYNYNSILCAVENGHVEILEYISGFIKIVNPSNIFNEAIKRGYLDIALFCYAKYSIWNDDTLELVTKYGHLDIIKYIYDNGIGFDYNIAYIAAEYGHLHMRILVFLNYD